MPRVRSAINNAQHGFSVVEAVLAASVFGLIAVAAVGAIVYGRATGNDTGNRVRAVLRAEEGIEATRNIGGAAYANLVDGTRGLTQSGVPLAWNYLGASDVNDIFTRQIVIASGGTNRKDITSTVSWPDAPTGTNTASIHTRMTNWRANIAQWSAGIASGSLNATGTTDSVKVATAGNYAYLVRNTNASNFLVVDISNPASPSLVSTITATGTPTNIKVSGNYAYVVTQSDTNELDVIDISNPASPSQVRTVNLTGTGNPTSVAVSGNYAYIARMSDTATNADEITVVNITTPASATEVPTAQGYNNNISMNGIYISGGFAYVATGSTTQEMLVLNLSVPTTPTLTVAYNAPTSVTANTISGYGTFVFLGAGTTLSSINVATPSSPAQVDTVTAAGTINDIEIDITQGFAFIGTSSTTSEFQIVSVANPANTSIVRTVDVTGTTSTLSGIAYNTTYDIAIGASASDTQELIIFRRN